jgi:hypothetical protein
MNKHFYFLGGLPRTGSTLLCSILAQNPSVHSEGSSVLIDLMWHHYWNTLNAEKNNWNEDIIASNLEERVTRVMKSLPFTYYQDIDKPFILDKCRSWTLPVNMHIARKFITKTPKVLVLVRPTQEIVSSFVKLRIDSGWEENSLFQGLLDDGGGLITKCVEGVINAKESNNGEFLFVTYDEIVYETKQTLNKIYNFFEWPKFDHLLDNITRPFVQKDEVYNMSDLHKVRDKIAKQSYEIILPTNVVKKCKYFDSLMFED